jgi:hypothetical protein
MDAAVVKAVSKDAPHVVNEMEVGDVSKMLCAIAKLAEKGITDVVW